MTNSNDKSELGNEIAWKTDAAIGVLLESGEDPSLAAVTVMPRASMERRLTQAALDLGMTETEARKLTGLATDDHSAANVASVILDGLGRENILEDEINEAYRRRSEMMLADPGTLAAAALLLLVLKLKKVHVSSGATEVDFYPIKNEILQALKGLLWR